MTPIYNIPDFVTVVLVGYFGMHCPHVLYSVVHILVDAAFTCFKMFLLEICCPKWQAWQTIAVYIVGGKCHQHVNQHFVSSFQGDVTQSAANHARNTGPNPLSFVCITQYLFLSLISMFHRKKTKEGELLTLCQRSLFDNTLPMIYFVCSQISCIGRAQHLFQILRKFCACDYLELCNSNTLNYNVHVPCVDLSPHRLPFSFITNDVAEATCQCLLAQAEQTEQKHHSQAKAEKLILEEFGQCLWQVIDSAGKTKGMSHGH